MIGYSIYWKPSPCAVGDAVTAFYGGGVGNYAATIASIKGGTITVTVYCNETGFYCGEQDGSPVYGSPVHVDAAKVLKDGQPCGRFIDLRTTDGV